MASDDVYSVKVEIIIEHKAQVPLKCIHTRHIKEDGKEVFNYAESSGPVLAHPSDEPCLNQQPDEACTHEEDESHS